MEKLNGTIALRIIIYGAGAVGGVVGSYLALSGSDVILVCRPGHAAAIRDYGLQLVTPTTTHVLHIPSVSTPEQIYFQSCDVVFISVKSQDTESTLKYLRELVADIPVFCFQNGIRNEEIASKYFPRVYGVRVRVDSIFLKDGEVMARRNPPGWLILGLYPAGKDSLVESVAERLGSAGFYTKVTTDVMPYKWGKLLDNLSNAIIAITDTNVGANNPFAKAAREEAEDILTQAGIRSIGKDELIKDWPEIAIKPRHSLAINAKSSTWQSLSRRLGSVETDFLNGEIVRVATKLGRKAPVNDMLLRISKQMAENHEPPGKYTMAELARLLGLE